MKNISYWLACCLFVLCSARAWSKPLDINNLNQESIACRGKDQVTCQKQLRLKIEKQKQRSFNIALVHIESEFGEESAKVATSLLKKSLVVSGVNVLDRKINQQIRKELKLIAAGGKRQTKGFSYADFAVKGEVLNLVTDRVFKIAENNCTLLGDDCPIRCEVKFDTTVRVSVFNTNPLSKVTDFTFSGENTKTYNKVTEQSCQQKDITQDLRLGFQKIFSENAGMITGSFAENGYVTALATSGKKTYVRSHLVKSEKYPKGTKAEIIVTSTVNDPLLGEITQVKTLGEGKVVNTKGDNYLWIQLKRQSDPVDILIGDIIKINAKVTKCGAFDMKCKRGS
ncbi:MAG: hypothetical protein KTR17_09750 [Cellvibrionaceae bacterium]|nr:hypothetical protein [Cellvibrionaceae bacterium]